MEVEGEEHTDPAMTTSRHRLHQLRNIMEQDQDGLMTLYLYFSCFDTLAAKLYVLCDVRTLPNDLALAGLLAIASL